MKEHAEVNMRLEPPSWWWQALVIVVAASLIWFMADKDSRGGGGREPFAKNLKDLHRKVERWEPSASQAFRMPLEAKVLEWGRGLFMKECASCHGNEGQGIVGPNLTDAYWIHDADPKGLFYSVAAGWPSAGMPSWGMRLEEEDLEALVAFLLSIKGKNLEGRLPEGRPVD